MIFFLFLFIFFFYFFILFFYLFCVCVCVWEGGGGYIFLSFVVFLISKRPSFIFYDNNSCRLNACVKP